MKLPTVETLLRLRAAPPQPIVVRGDDLLTVLSLIQLALRNPRLPKASRRAGREFAAQLESRLLHVAPEFGDIVKMGWDGQDRINQVG